MKDPVAGDIAQSRCLLPPRKRKERIQRQAKRSENAVREMQKQIRNKKNTLRNERRRRIAIAKVQEEVR